MVHICATVHIASYYATSKISTDYIHSQWASFANNLHIYVHMSHAKHLQDFNFIESKLLHMRKCAPAASVNHVVKQCKTVNHAYTA